MSWDDIQLTAGDVIGNDRLAVSRHPCQLIMSAAEVIKIDQPMSYVVCVNSTRKNDRAIVEMNHYGFNGVPVPYINRPVAIINNIGLLPVRRVSVMMGLCACGRLYWHPLADKVVTLQIPMGEKY